MTVPTIPTIDVPTLRSWIEDYRPLSLLDVRRAADSPEWWTRAAGMLMPPIDE